MNIFPAIDLYEGKAVRLYRGDYAQMTVYSEDPISVVKDFVRAGARFIHVVDLEGARFGGTPNLPVVRRICAETDLFLEVGGGIRDMETAKAYLSAGRVARDFGNCSCYRRAFSSKGDRALRRARRGRRGSCGRVCRDPRLDGEKRVYGGCVF